VLRHVAEFPTGVTEAEPVISRRPALDGRSFPDQRNRFAKVSFVVLEGVGLDLEGKISFGHIGSNDAPVSEISLDRRTMQRF
jgi:hypothetical protein